MLSSGCFFLFAILIFVNVATPFQEDYYWREYTGTIPRDAIVGGKDLSGKNVYIGQAYVKNVGLIPVEINLGVPDVYVAIYGNVTKVDYVKILCGPQQNSYWLLTDAGALHTNLESKQAVTGGHVDYGGVIHIGRMTSGGEFKIGRILTYSEENPYFYYNNNGQEGSNQNYGVLVYEKEVA